MRSCEAKTDPLGTRPPTEELKRKEGGSARAEKTDRLMTKRKKELARESMERFPENNGTTGNEEVGSDWSSHSHDTLFFDIVSSPSLVVITDSLNPQRAGNKIDNGKHAVNACLPTAQIPRAMIVIVLIFREGPMMMDDQTGSLRRGHY